MVDDGELKLYRENGSLVYIVPENARFMFYEAHAGLFTGHLSAKKLLRKLKKKTCVLAKYDSGRTQIDKIVSEMFCE